MKVPVRSLYFLLGYAWDALPLLNAADVSEAPPAPTPDLLARVLLSAAQDAVRRGLDRGYIECDEVLPAIRGRIDFNRSARSLALERARAHCIYDDLSHDVLQNRILKATLWTLSCAQGLASSNRDALRVLWARLGSVSPHRVVAEDFDRVTVHRNNRNYRMLMNVCRLVHDSVLVDVGQGHVRFADFSDESGMPLLFEHFVRRFYEREQRDFAVSSPRFRWQQAEGDAEALALLPELRTDVVLTDAQRLIVVDTKFLARTLSRDKRFQKESLHPGNVFQLYAYVRNLALRDTHGRRVEGLLLYPQVERRLRAEYRLHGFRVRAATVDLMAQPEAIREELLSLLS